ncbi:P80 family lipoprotein [[Mycoplasma] cavipharyngis]|uniref:P68 family surface lipoprotein n=1 Tax=[Mycoplasma] cavipharyngis TaxID=92757 RepID=UPI0037038667
MKISIRKLLFASLIPTVSASLLLAACSSGSSVNTKEVLIGLPWTSSDRRFQNLQKIAEKFNNEIKTAAKQEQGYLPVKINSQGDGYNNVATNIIRNITIRNWSNVPNLTLNYPPVVSGLASVSGQLDLSQDTYNKDNNTIKVNNKTVTLASDKFDTNLVSDQFLKVNQNIYGIDSQDKGLYLLPIGLSSEILYLNKPVLKYLLNKVLEKETSVTIDSTSTEWFKKEFGIEKKSTTSSDTKSTTSTTTYTNSSLEDKVQKIYGEYKKNNEKKFDNYVLKKSVFENWDGLVDLAAKLAASFPYSLAKNSSSATSTASNTETQLKDRARMLQFDAPVSFLYNYSFNQLNHDYKKYLWNRSDHAKANEDFKYTFFKNGTEQSIAFQNAYNKLYEVAKNGGYGYVVNKDDNINTRFANLEIAISMGSNARYKQKVPNKDKQLTDKDVLTLSQPLKNSESTTTQNSYVLQGGHIIGINLNNNKVANRATRLFIKWLFTNNTEYLYNTNQKTSVSYAEDYALKSSYVPSAKSFFNNKTENSNPSNKDKELILNSPAAKTAYQLFKSASQNNTTYVPYLDPANQTANDLRLAIPSTINLFLKSSAKLESYQNFINGIRKQNNRIEIAYINAQK